MTINAQLHSSRSNDLLELELVIAYAHLDSYSPCIIEGASVARGQAIVAMGTTDSSTASYLHYELSYQGKRIDPFLGD